MARLSKMAGNAEKVFAKAESGRALAALLAVMACVGAGLSGCAGLAKRPYQSDTAGNDSDFSVHYATPRQQLDRPPDRR
jgi:hypothetical protein